MYLDICKIKKNFYVFIPKSNNFCIYTYPTTLLVLKRYKTRQEVVLALCIILAVISMKYYIYSNARQGSCLKFGT